MSRKFIVAIAAVAALGMSTLLATDALARGGGGHGGGGHGGLSRPSFSHARTMPSRNFTRTRTSRPTHTKNTRVVKHPKPQHVRIVRHHHDREWCRHHRGRCGGPWIDVGVDGGGYDVVTTAPQPVVAATPAAAVCTNDCDYFIKDEPGCYMAKRAFSTPAGDELRCVKICDEAEGKRAEK